MIWWIVHSMARSVSSCIPNSEVLSVVMVRKCESRSRRFFRRWSSALPVSTPERYSWRTQQQRERRSAFGWTQPWIRTGTRISSDPTRTQSGEAFGFELRGQNLWFVMNWCFWWTSNVLLHKLFRQIEKWKPKIAETPFFPFFLQRATCWKNPATVTSLLSLIRGLLW